MNTKRRLSQTSTSSHDDPSESSLASSVSFGVVEVREFERIVCDHPGVSDEGPPLGLGWGYYDNGVKAPVDTFEMTHGPYPYKQKDLQPLKADVRRIILQKFFDVPEYEIREATKAVARMKKQRNETVEKQQNELSGSQGNMLKTVQSVMDVASKRIRLRWR